MRITGRRRQALVSGMSALLMVLLATQSVLAAVTWTAPVKATPSYSYNYGQGLAKTTSTVSGKTYLHAQYTYLNTTNPGVYYRRGTAGASTWGTPKRLNPGGEFAENGVIAAADRYVYVAYQKITSWAHYDPAADRLLVIRTNTNHGSSSAWLPYAPGGPGRVGRPAIAASGSWAYVVHTDADTGDIRFVSNLGVNNAEGGFVAGTIGTTTNDAINPDDGKDGYPVVAASGASVLVAWISGDGTTISAKVSTDRGKTWPATATTITSARVWDLSAAGAGGRLGLAWAQESAVKAKLFRSGAWNATKTVASFSPTGTYKTGYGTSIAMTGTARVGVAWSTCTRLSCNGSSTYGVNIRWRESTDNLSSWKSAQTIASYASSKYRRINDYPTALMSSKPTRWIMYNTASASLSTFSTMVEVGRGTP